MPRPALCGLASARRERGGRDTAAIREAVFWAVDSCLAEASRDFPSDGAVTRGAAQTIDALCEDPRFSAPQIQAAASADLDLLRFPVQEMRMMTYAPVPEAILERLPEIHPLTDLPRAR